MDIPGRKRKIFLAQNLQYAKAVFGDLQLAFP
jgi:hypothetical protein